MEKKIALYVMNSKGLYVAANFVRQFGAGCVSFIVSAKDDSSLDESYSELKSLSEKHGITFYDRKHVDKYVESNFTGYKFAVGWRWIIPNYDNLVVFHDSLLPKFRGFAPLVNSLVAGEPKIGVTALTAHKNYDEGPILGQECIDITYPITIRKAISLIEPLYFQLVEDIYTRIAEDKLLAGCEQDNERATFSLWLDEEDYFIDWTWSAGKIERFVNAVGYPFDSAKTKYRDQVIKVKEVEVVDDVAVEHRERHIGKVIFYDDVPIIVCGSGLLKLNQLEDSAGQAIKVSFRTRFR